MAGCGYSHHSQGEYKLERGRLAGRLAAKAGINEGSGTLEHSCQAPWWLLDLAGTL
jgi:hypothetical protein